MDRNAVMGLVIKRLYFGRRPPNGDMAMNGSILARLNAKGRTWEELGKMVEGLALLRDKGELKPTVQPKEPVSLRWVYDGGMMVNQVNRCLDAFYNPWYKSQPAPEVTKRGGKPEKLTVDEFWYSKQAPTGSVEESVQEDAKWEGNDEPEDGDEG